MIPWWGSLIPVGGDNEGLFVFPDEDEDGDVDEDWKKEFEDGDGDWGPLYSLPPLPSLVKMGIFLY